MHEGKSAWLHLRCTQCLEDTYCVGSILRAGHAKPALTEPQKACRKKAAAEEKRRSRSETPSEARNGFGLQFIPWLHVGIPAAIDQIAAQTTKLYTADARLFWAAWTGKAGADGQKEQAITGQPSKRKTRGGMVGVRFDCVIPRGNFFETRLETRFARRSFNVTKKKKKSIAVSY